MVVSFSLIALLDIDSLFKLLYRAACFIMSIGILAFEMWRLDGSEKDYKKLCEEMEAKK
jgi:hypothetical protein